MSYKKKNKMGTVFGRKFLTTLGLLIPNIPQNHIITNTQIEIKSLS